MSELTIRDLGQEPERTAVLHAEHLEALAATLSRRPPELGQPMPICWHWAFFNPATPSAQLGPDGHPARDPHGPTGAFPRRMWAAGTVEMTEPLLVGSMVTRHSEVVESRRTAGRTGELLLVTIEHRYESNGTIAMTEHQRVVYRQQGDPVPLPEDRHRETSPPDGWMHPVTWTPIDLFRFSALTFNSHRIHYDQTYATSVEGYPALVVHGPLTALTLAHSAADHLGASISAIEFRATAPLFVGQRHWMVGRPSPTGADLTAVRADGAVAMTASVRA